MGMLLDVIGSLVDMSKLSKLTETLEPEIEALKKEGKCPDELAKVFDSIKNAKSDGSATDSAKDLENAIKTIEKYGDLFSSTVKENLPKILNVVEDLEKKASDIEKKTK